MNKTLSLISLIAGIITIIIFISGKQYLPNFFQDPHSQKNKIQTNETYSGSKTDTEISPNNTDNVTVNTSSNEEPYSSTPDAIWPGETFIDEYTGVTFGLIEITGEFNKAHYAKIKLSLPDQNETIEKDDVTAGDFWKYKKNNKTFKITFTLVHPAFCEIKISEVNN